MRKSAQCCNIRQAVPPQLADATRVHRLLSQLVVRIGPEAKPAYPVISHLAHLEVQMDTHVASESATSDDLRMVVQIHTHSVRSATTLRLHCRST